MRYMTVQSILKCTLVSLFTHAHLCMCEKFNKMRSQKKRYHTWVVKYCPYTYSFLHRFKTLIYLQ